MINTDVFNYIDVLHKAADAGALRNKAIANNISNVDTPGYKRQDVSFATEFERALRHSRFKSLDEKIDNLNIGRLKGRVYTDAISYSYRLDGNNVDVDTENVELASNQILMEGITGSITSEFKNLMSVCK
ncbi:MAG: flagellar basal body rod protein FlgB [Lachnospiraceae bacterium]|nr:flagellar basal body rod protein FlgB [Lachnospiraceae bacterium]MCR5776010.1 flagellar basal body rod protein FlgB [Lachnospiraceae bacterium]